MNPYVTFGMMFLVLLDTYKYCELGVQFFNYQKLARDLETNAGLPRLQEQFGPLFANALWRKLAQLERFAKLCGFSLYRKSKTPRKLHRAQYAQRIICKSFGVNHLNTALLYVFKAAVGIYNFSREWIEAERIYSKIPPARGFANSHFWIALDFKPLVPYASLRVSPRDRDIETFNFDHD